MNNQIANADQWRFSIETVTPDRAADILEKCNRANRNIRPAVVKKYARIMAEGNWRLSPEAIVIADTGRLLSGQHRLTALVSVGITARFLFIYGPDESTFEILDRGAVRSTADALRENRKAVEAAKLACTIKAGWRADINDFDVKEMLTHIGDEHSMLMDACNSSAATFSSAAFRLCAVARVLGGADRSDVHNLYRSLVLGNTENLPPVGHAVVRMHLSGGIKMLGRGGGFQTKLVCLAWSVFDPDKQYNTRLLTRQMPIVSQEIIEAIYGKS